LVERILCRHRRSACEEDVIRKYVKKQGQKEEVHEQLHAQQLSLF